MENLHFSRSKQAKEREKEATMADRPAWRWTSCSNLHRTANNGFWSVSCSSCLFAIWIDLVKSVCMNVCVTCCMGFSAAEPGCLCSFLKACGIHRPEEAQEAHTAAHLQYDAWTQAHTKPGCYSHACAFASPPRVCFELCPLLPSPIFFSFTKFIYEKRISAYCFFFCAAVWRMGPLTVFHIPKSLSAPILSVIFAVKFCRNLQLHKTHTFKYLPIICTEVGLKGWE